MLKALKYLFICIICLSGCGQSPVTSQLYNAVKPLFEPKKPFLTQERISKLAYAAVSAKIGSGPETILVLGRMDGENHHYFSSDKSLVIINNGRIVRTHGLSHNLWYTGFSGLDLFTTGLHKLTVPEHENRIIDLNREGLQHIHVNASFIPCGVEKLVIYEKEYVLKKIREHVTVPELKWTYENTHWVFPDTGLVMKTIQHVHPQLDPLQINILTRAQSK